MKPTTALDVAGVYKRVHTLLGADTSGHGMDHVDRVLRLAREFAKHEGADEKIVVLAALLHDVDDYKLFGEEYAKQLVNANQIMDMFSIRDDTRTQVTQIIRSMGYSRYLEGIRPTTLEGMVVSDADMCDAIGASGILRTHAYALTKGNTFFDRSLQPQVDELTALDYKAMKKSHSVQHFFDKLLKIPSLLMTEAGQAEAKTRQALMIDFLRQLFEEENALVWQEYLRKYEETKGR